ncbi:dolichol-phosphate mannosyltransferase [Bacteroidia bacterium]|nr:dolichol-phosphate mannosyltransferase [Bacteroidia bacterium]
MDSIVVIPTYNEKENIEAIIRKVFSLSHPFHVLIVDDHSPDGTADIVKRLMQEFPDRLFINERQGKMGLGTAYIHGFKYALANEQYRYIFEMDADFSHNPEDLLRLRDVCANGKADVAIGSRYVGGMVNVVNWPMGRVMLSYYASKYVRLITRIPIGDATAGFVCYTRQVLQTINFNRIKFVGYAFQIEMKYTAHRLGFNLAEVPIVFTDRTLGQSKMSKGIIMEALIGVFQLRLRKYKRNNE